MDSILILISTSVRFQELACECSYLSILEQRAGLSAYGVFVLSLPRSEGVRVFSDLCANLPESSKCLFCVIRAPLSHGRFIIENFLTALQDGAHTHTYIWIILYVRSLSPLHSSRPVNPSNDWLRSRHVHSLGPSARSMYLSFFVCRARRSTQGSYTDALLIFLIINSLSRPPSAKRLLRRLLLLVRAIWFFGKHVAYWFPR